MNILIVEDDLFIADFLAEALSEDKYRVCGIARTMNDAVRLARLHTPDVAIVDVCLGAGGLGTDFSRLLNAHWPIQILFASGNTSDVRLFSAGGSAMIAKPYTVAALTRALEILGDLATRGSTERRLPDGMRLLDSTLARRPAPIAAV